MASLTKRKKRNVPRLVAAVLVLLLGATGWVYYHAGKGIMLREGRLAAPAVILDEGFARSRPSLAAALSAVAAELPGRRRYAEISLAAGPGAFLEAAAANGYLPIGQKAPPGILSQAAGIIASPLFAATLTEAARQAEESGMQPPGGPGESREAPLSPVTTGFSAIGGEVLVTPEWLGQLPEGLATAVTDARAAYRDMGKAAGLYIVALRATAATSPTTGDRGAAGKATAAILFRERPSRPRACLDAFIEGFSELGIGPPVVETMIDAALSDPELDASVANLLAADIRVVLVSIGPRTRDAEGRLERQGLAVGADSSEAAEVSNLAFGIVPDNEALVRGLASLAASGKKMERLDIPALLFSGQSASSYQAGDSDLGKCIAQALSKAQNTSGFAYRNPF